MYLPDISYPIFILLFMWERLIHLNKLKNTVPNPFIKRIRSLVIGEGMLNEGNIGLMDFAIQHLPAEGSMLEIGSYGGLSTNLMIYLKNKYRKFHPFFTCDAWIYEGYNDHLQEVADVFIDGRPDVLRSDYSVYMKTAFIHATKLLSPQNLPFSFHQYSNIFFKIGRKIKQKPTFLVKQLRLAALCALLILMVGTPWKWLGKILKMWQPIWYATGLSYWTIRLMVNILEAHK